MAKKQGASAQQTARPAQPSWRKPPVRSRRQVRERQLRKERTRAEPARGTRLPAEITPIASQPARTGARADNEPGANGARAGASPRDWRGVLRILRHGFVLVLLAATVYGLVQFFQLPAFAITSGAAQIGGVRRLSPRVIYDTSGVEGRNIFLLRRAEIEANVRAVAGVASAEVYLRLPNQVLIDIREHTPLVAWRSGSETVWLAADGAEVPQTGTPPPLTLTDTTGAPLAQSRQLWLEVLPQLAALYDYDQDIIEFHYGDPQGLYYQAAKGWEVWLGDTGSMTAKMLLAARAQPEIERSGAQAKVIDLRFSEDEALWW